MLLAGLYALFSLTDYFLVPDSFYLFFKIRFFIVIPLLVATVALTFHSNYYKWNQMLITLDFVVGGLGIVVMLLVEPQNISYYLGLFLVLTAGFFMLRLSAMNAIIGGTIIFGGYILGITATADLNLTNFSVALFLLAENIIGAMGALQIEVFKRKEFIDRQELNCSYNNMCAVVEEKKEELTKAQEATIFSLAKLAESRDKKTGEHLDRVGNLSYLLACIIPEDYFESAKHMEEFTQAIRLASSLHDIGKVGISDNILNKPGPLDENEWKIMQTHSELGYVTLKELSEQYPNNVFINLGLEVTISHHEKWDGSGYPHKLAGYDIPLSARIMAIVDAYDALTNERPYKAVVLHERALDIIRQDSGKHFDPILATYFFALFSE